VTSDRTPAVVWDAEYSAGRHRDELPVSFTRDILAAARQAGAGRGPYIGCGNGRNYLPLVGATRGMRAHAVVSLLLTG
jgi:hypothetical protein